MVAFSIPAFTIGLTLSYNPGIYMWGITGVDPYFALAIGPAMVAASIGMSVFGCNVVARSNGYSGWLGALGVLGFVGVLVLLFLPVSPKQREDGHGVSDPTAWPPPPSKDAD